MHKCLFPERFRHNYVTCRPPVRSSRASLRLKTQDFLRQIIYSHSQWKMKFAAIDLWKSCLLDVFHYSFRRTIISISRMTQSRHLIIYAATDRFLGGFWTYCADRLNGWHVCDSFIIRHAYASRYSHLISATYACLDEDKAETHSSNITRAQWLISENIVAKPINNDTIGLSVVVC